jgi:hypothetical protein
MLTDLSSPAPTTTASSSGGGSTGNAPSGAAQAIGVKATASTGPANAPSDATDSSSSSAGTETGQAMDSATATISQFLGAAPGQAHADKTQTGTIQRITLVGGVLYQAPPRSSPHKTPRAVPSLDQEYSSWGNEALWR